MDANKLMVASAVALFAYIVMKSDKCDEVCQNLFGAAGAEAARTAAAAAIGILLAQPIGTRRSGRRRA